MMIITAETAASLLLTLAIVLLSALPSHAQSTPLKGIMSIGGLTVVDAPPGEPKNTHAGFVIEGAAARRLFKAMKAKAEPDACMDDGWVTKFAGPMFCAMAPKGKEARCFVRLSLIDGKTEGWRQGC